MDEAKQTIYQLIEEILKNSGEALTGLELLEHPGVKEKLYAMYEKRGKTVASDYGTHISNTLGYLWRKGLVDRYKSRKYGGRSWYVYKYKERNLQISPPAQTSKLDYMIKDEKDSVTLEFENFEITIKRKPKRE
jgi:hypothetical protein